MSSSFVEPAHVSTPTWVNSGGHKVSPVSEHEQESADRPRSGLGLIRMNSNRSWGKLMAHTKSIVEEKKLEKAKIENVLPSKKNFKFLKSLSLIK